MIPRSRPAEMTSEQAAAQHRTASLDPSDWPAFRREAHRALDAMIDHLEHRRAAPVWQQMPRDVVSGFAQPLPRSGRPLAAVLDDVARTIVPYATGNTHPAFMGWVHGAGTPVGMVAEMIAAGLDMNCGGRNHVGIALERQVTRWTAEALGLPAESSGVFVTGSSMANAMAVLIARTRVLGPASRDEGVNETAARLRAYTSEAAHGCITRAMEVAGLGRSRLRRIATTATGAMCAADLTQAILADRAAGLTPFLVVGAAGTVDTGAVDPLSELASIATLAGAWFHVDGAIGALACLSPSLRPTFAGIERADSVALDFHKWGHVPYDAGFLIVADAAAHRAAFAGDAPYLQRATEGLAAGGDWPCDFGPDLSRSCRALKTWMTIEVLGADRIGCAIEDNCRMAQRLARRVEESGVFELKAPVGLNVVCFGLKGHGHGEANRRAVTTVQCAGVAAPSWTVIRGEVVIRTAIVNHRTTAADVDGVVDALVAAVQESVK